MITLLLLTSVTALAATVPVTDSISEAMDRADNGDTLQITGPRVFREHVVVTKELRLVGTGSPVLDGLGTGTPLTIRATGVEVTGLVVRNSGRDLTRFDSAVLTEANGTTIRECKIQNDGFGIYLRGASDCRIIGNEISGDPQLPGAARGNGIHLWKTRGNQIAANVIHDKRDGMYLSYADRNVLSQNRVSDTRFGIHYMYSHENRLLENSLVGNTAGAVLMFSRGSLVSANLALANRRHGIVMKQVDNSVISSNVVVGQNRGFFVQQATANRFVANVIATNDIGLYLSNCSEQNLFLANAFVRNIDQVWQPPFETQQGQNSGNVFSQKGQGNFWSDYAGGDRDHDGIGDVPYHETDVYGYILDRHPEVRILALSPAVALLRKSEELLPLLDLSGVTDLSPLMTFKAPRLSKFHEQLVADRLSAASERSN